jgi:hypothetical protein
MLKRGQITVFIIVAIAIIAVILVLYLVPKTGVVSGDVNPSAFLRNCIEPNLKNTIDKIGKSGGYIEPSHYLTFGDDRIQYLCYTNTNYEPCQVQQPLLVQHVKNEIIKEMGPVSRNCMSNLVQEYEKRGFDADSTPGDVEVSIGPGRISVDFLSPLTLTKENTQRFEKFAIGLDSEMYDLLIPATSIIQFESTLGNADSALYVQYFPDLRIQKIERSEGTVYKLSNVVSGDEFVFASRSLVFPAGYGFEEALA